jgi:hypothetical protein
MDSINFDVGDLEDDAEHSPDRYNGKESVEGSVEDMLTNLNDQA